MSRSKRNTWTTAAVAISAVLLLVSAALVPSTGHASRERPTQVVQYFQGKVVGTWTATKVGQMDGPSYVFEVRDGASTRSVRITGTFTAEELP